MRILVTGGAGYIGRVLVPMLVEEGNDVVVLDRLFLNDDDVIKEYSSLGVDIIRDDVRYFDPSVLKDKNAVVDLAALSNDPSGDLDIIKTWDINYLGRMRVARLAKKIGIQRYIVASSCSVYGFREEVADESTPVNPLTAYAEANVAVESDNLHLNDRNFTATALRFATAFGYSKRMRFDIAINGMTLDTFKYRKIRLMRDGSQYRPFVHVKDISKSIIATLSANMDDVGGEVFNVGSDEQNVQLKALAGTVQKVVNNDSQIEWYGDPDRRSYRVSFSKINDRLKFKTEFAIDYGVREIFEALENGTLNDTPQTRTVQFYKNLLDAESLIKKYGYGFHGRIL